MENTDHQQNCSKRKDNANSSEKGTWNFRNEGRATQMVNSINYFSKFFKYVQQARSGGSCLQSQLLKRLEQEDHLSPEVKNQPGQYRKTQSQNKQNTIIAEAVW
jgi:hypothetical protein